MTYFTKAKCFVIGLLMSSTSFAQTTQVDQPFCDGIALLAKAGVEAKHRGASLGEWRNDLLTMNSYIKNRQDNILFRVLPRAIKDANVSYRSKQTPVEIYVDTFKRCMATELGQVVSL